MLTTLFFLILSMAVPAWTQEKDWEKEWNDTLSAAKKEGKLVIRVNNPERVLGEISTRFKQRFGVSIDPVRIPEQEVAAKLRAERESGIYSIDVFISGSGTVPPLYREKMFDPVKPLLILPEVLDPAKWKGGKLDYIDPEKKFFPRLIRPVGSQDRVFINTDHVKAEEFRFARDLLEPKFRGKISSDDPTLSGGGGGLAAQFYFLFGEDFVRTLYVDQKPFIDRNRRQLTEWLAQGKYPIAMEPHKDSVQELQKKGHPIVALRLRDFPDAVTVGGGLVALMNRPPHPHAARLFLNWIASKEGLEIFSRARLEPTTRNDIDESFLRPELIPRPGVEYFDSANWEFLTVKEKVTRYMKELLNRG